VPQNIPVRENLTEESFSPENAFPEDETAPSAKKVSEKLPQILELGSDSCMPCMMMRPILAELTAEYKGQFAVEFVDVYKNTSIPEKYKIRGIPTQIFLDAQGKEISRNSGFMPKDDILARWKSLGYEFKKNPLPEKQDK
ncbi:MAG TPA: thioredoxin family protein, partial [bacterium]|nr:thioredoxin family protein [bacterium]